MKTEPYSIRLTNDLKFFISEYAQFLGIRNSEAIRFIILTHLKEHHWSKAELDEDGNEILPF